MRKLPASSLWLGVLIEIACCSSLSFAGPLQSVSVADKRQPPPAGGSGDSLGPIISQDGRYVLFASTANNLVVLGASNTPLPVLIPPRLNVFLRDRTNGTTTLVSANLAGTGGGNGDSLPVSISTNGQYVLFESTAGDLVAGDTNGVNDVFIRDLVHGTTALVSVSTNGSCANGLSRNSVMTPDGRYVAFTSEASNLVAFDTNGIADVFVRDMQGGTTTLASVGALSAGALLSSLGQVVSASDWPDITPDGHYVAFSSTATNLIPGGQTAGDIYVRDLIGGTTIWASGDARAEAQNVFNATNTVCQNHTISADGRYVAFEARPVPNPSPPAAGIVLRYGVLSSLTDVVNTNAGVSTQPFNNTGDLNMTPDGEFLAFVGNTNVASPAETCIFVWSAQSGTSTLASVNLSGSASSNAICDWPVIDPRGRYVAFQSTATDLTTNSLLGSRHLLVRDLLAGTTALVDADANGVGTGVGPDAVPSLATNGPSVAFQSPDSNLVPNDRNRALDVFVRNLSAGTNELVSACQPALSSLTPNGLSALSLLAMNSNGRYIAFTSDADNLVPNDTNGWRDVFVRDLLLGTNVLVSVATNGGVGNDESFGPSISGDGRYVAFTSSASNLVAGDLNNSQDVFVRDTQSGTTILASVNTNGVSGGNDSYSPIITGNDRFVVFRSRANDLVSTPLFPSGAENLFLRDLQMNKTYALTTGGDVGVTPAVSPDGRFIVFVGSIAGSSFQLFVWDTQTMQRVYTNATPNISSVATSPDGNMIVFAFVSQLSIVNRALNTTNPVVSLFPLRTVGTMSFTSDGHWLVYALTGSSIGYNPEASDVYQYDTTAMTNGLVSHSVTSAQPANGPSGFPVISSTGRFVAYRSAASDLTPNATNGARGIYIYDQTNASNILITVSAPGNTAANSHSMVPVFSGDGQTLVFQSWSSDLVAGDANFNSDIFAYALVTNAANQPFFAQIVAGSQPGAAAIISWTAVPGKTYTAQYKNNVTDTGWQSISGGITIVGSQGFFMDPAPSSSQRFYRIVEF
jgi:Tol biopolymer transport system component